MRIIKLALLNTLVCSLNADTLSEAFSKAKVDGEFRVVHYSRDADNSIIFAKANGTALGGNLGISTKSINNIKTNLRFYTTNKIDGSDAELSNTNLVDGTDSYSVVGEANIEYDDGTNMLRIGRQTLYTPLVASDDARVIKDFFEAVNFSTLIVPKTKLSALYIKRNSGMDNGAKKSDFVSMSKTLGTSYDEGMAVFGLENNSIKDLTLQAWYYDSIKLVDMFYYDASYKFDFSKDKSLKLEAHYWNIKSKSEYEVDTGKKIDYNYGGARASFTNGDLLLQLAKEQINYKDNTVGIHTSWGMYTEYTYGYLMGSGIYGATNGIGGEYVTKVDATKFTLRYDITNDVDIYIGYNIYDANNDAFMSDMNLLDLYIGFPCQLVDNAKYSLLYENWDSDGDNIMVDNNLLRLKYTYSF